jgi:ankyrin repeat protein
MKTKFHTLIQTAMLTAALAVACAGCFLIPPSHSSYRPIHEYAADGNVTAVAQDIATNSHDLNLPDDAGRTPLHLAATHCHTNVVALLLDKGAKIDPRAAGGTTPLHLAAQGGCVEVVNLLLAKGAKVNARDDQNRTPLDRAMQWHQDAVAELIRQHGGLSGTNR